jgi:hypothetical protein
MYQSPFVCALAVVKPNANIIVKINVLIIIILLLFYYVNIDFYLQGAL